VDRVVSERRETRRLAVYSTAYPAAAPFIPAWAASLAKQTDPDFELWVGLDGISPREVCELAGRDLDAHWVTAVGDESPSALRARAIGQVAYLCEAIVFVDCDDEMFADRIASARRSLAEHEVVACGLTIVDEAGHDTGVVFGPRDGTEWGEFLPRYNAFGLSNSAYRSDTLRRLAPAPAVGPAFDWSLATRALCAGASMHFDRTPHMAYRQYAANTAKVLPPFGAQDVARATEVVRAHYRSMLEGGVPMPREFHGRLEAARERVENFRTRVVEHPELLERYVTNLNAIEPLYVWWWAVANPDLELQWREWVE
jgi:hypothetical protein